MQRQQSPLFVKNPSTPKLFTSPLSPEASTKTPVISNLSNDKRKSKNKRPLNRFQGKSPRRSIHSDFAAVPVRHTDSPTVVTGNIHSSFNKRTKSSEDPPSDISLDNTTTSTTVKTAQDPEGNHILARTSERPITEGRQPDASPRNTDTARKLISVSNLPDDPKKKVVPATLGRAQIFELRDVRQETKQQLSYSYDWRSPTRSSPQPSPQRQERIPEKSRTPQKVRRNNEEEREDIEVSRYERRESPRTPKPSRTKKESARDVYSTHSHGTAQSQSLYTFGTSTQQSMSVQSMETFPSRPAYYSKDRELNDSVFERAVNQCGDIIYATVTAVAETKDKNSKIDVNKSSRSANKFETEDEEPVIAEIVPNLSDVTGTTQLTEKVQTIDASVCSTSWWINTFQKMQQQHQAEREKWENELAQAKGKKSAYKTELKSTLVNQLQWLENRMMSPDHLFPGISHASTNITRSVEHVPSQEGVEVPFDSAYQMKRIQQLEVELQNAIEQHEHDRTQWYTTLQEAAAVTATGEELSIKQQQQLNAIQKEAQAAVQKQREQWKEKTKVLTELLELTEQQHRQEIEEWNAEKQRLEKSIELVTAEKGELTVQFDRVLTDMQELTEDADQAYKEAVAQKEQATSALKLCNDFEEQAAAALKEAEKFKEECLRVQSDNSKLKEEIKLLNQQRHENFISGENHENSIKELQQQLNATQKELLEVKEQASAALKLCCDYEAQVDATLADASKWQNEVDKLTEEKESLKEKNDILTREAEQQKNEIDSLKEQIELSNTNLNEQKLELESVKNQYELAGKDIEVLKKEVDSANELIKSSKEELDSANKQLECAKNEIELRKAEVEAAQKQAESAKKEIDDTRDELESTKREVESAKKEIKDIREQAADFTEQAISSQSQCRKLQRNLAAASPPSDRGSSYRRQLFSGSRGTREANENDDEWEEKLDRAIAERDLYKQESDNISETLERVIAERDMLQNELDSILENLSLSTKAVEQAKLDHASAESAFTETMERLEQERDEHKQEVGVLLDQVTTLKNEMKEKQEQWKNETARKLQELLDEQKVLKQTHDTKDLQNRLAAVEAERDLYKKKSIEAADAFRKVKAQLKDDPIAKKYDSPDVAEDELHELVAKQQLQLKETSESEIMRKYHESIEKQNDLLHRIKLLETQRGNDRGSWKLQLEAALAESRKLGEEKKFLEKQLLTLKEQRKIELESLNEQINEQNSNNLSQLIEDTNEHNRCLLDQNEELQNSLEQFRLLNESSKLQLDRALTVIEELKEEIDFLKQNRNSNTSTMSADMRARQDIILQLDQHEYLLTEAVEELHVEMILMKQSIEALVQRADCIDLIGLHEIQSNLNEFAKKLHHKTKVILEHQQTFKSLIREMKFHRVDADKPIFGEQKEAVPYGVQELRESLLRTLRSEKAPGAIRLEDPIARELVAELHRKESALVSSKVELDKIRDRLDEERTKREQAECRNASLTAKADAYNEELMHLQLANIRLLERLEHQPTQEVDPEISFYDELAYSKSWENNDDNTSPLLDEALALAEGFTDIVHGKTDTKAEPTAMQMLESLSDMIEKHDAGWRKKMISSSPVCKDATKVKNCTPDYIEVIHTETLRTDTSGGTERIRYSSPLSQKALLRAASRNSFGSFGKKQKISDSQKTALNKKKPYENYPKLQHEPLQVLVEQLYGRCEMLERERIQLMEITLDLLESAHGADESQLNEALEIARKKCIEELTKLQQQTKVDQERIFHKLCNHYIKKERPKKEIKKDREK